MTFCEAYSDIRDARRHGVSCTVVIFDNGAREFGRIIGDHANGLTVVATFQGKGAANEDT